MCFETNGRCEEMNFQLLLVLISVFSVPGTRNVFCWLGEVSDSMVCGKIECVSQHISESSNIQHTRTFYKILHGLLSKITSSPASFMKSGGSVDGRVTLRSISLIFIWLLIFHEKLEFRLHFLKNLKFHGNLKLETPMILALSLKIISTFRSLIL